MLNVLSMCNIGPGLSRSILKQLILPALLVVGGSTWLDARYLDYRTKTGLSTGYLPWELGIRKPGHNICTTLECKTAAKNLIASMNVSVDPCDDFYEFACGGWIKLHPVPATEPHRNQFDVVSEKLDLQLKGILEEESKETEPFPVTAAKDTYKACMDTVNIESEGLQPLSDLLNDLGGWPMVSEDWNEDKFDWQKVVSKLSRILGLTPFVLTYVYLDRKNSSQSIITLDQPSLALSRSMLVDPSTYKIQLEAYRHWIAASAVEIAASQKSGVSKAQIVADAFELVDFESQLAKLTSPNEMRRNAFRMYNPMTLRELQKWTDSTDTVTSYGKIRWIEFFDDIFLDVGIKFSPKERIVVKEVDYLFNLMNFLDSSPPRLIANYVYWRVVKKLSRDTTQTMRDLAFQFHKVLTGTLQDQPRWRDCVGLTSSSLSFAVGYKYVSQFFDNEAKKSAIDMVENIRSAFKSHVRQADWMDDITRKVAQDKADAMTELIGYPNWYTNQSAFEGYYKGLSVGKSHFSNVLSLETLMVQRILAKLRLATDRTEWNTGPDVVNAYYNPQTNSIAFPAGILQPPFFSKGRIEALNYGSIGVVIGHEITHGFDDMGRQSDKQGNLAQWWTETTIETYVDKAQCFVDQYSSYRVPQLVDMLHTEMTVNGVTTQGENMADLGGLEQAFHAYEKFVEQTGPEPRLPGLQELSPEQLFFLGFATVWCESSTKESLLQEVLSDPHSPQRFRVQGTLANSRDFSRVWKCPLGSPMNPLHKCSMW